MRPARKCPSIMRQTPSHSAEATRLRPRSATISTPWSATKNVNQHPVVVLGIPYPQVREHLERADARTDLADDATRRKRGLDREADLAGMRALGAHDRVPNGIERGPRKQHARAPMQGSRMTQQALRCALPAPRGAAAAKAPTAAAESAAATAAATPKPPPPNPRPIRPRRRRILSTSPGSLRAAAQTKTRARRRRRRAR